MPAGEMPRAEIDIDDGLVHRLLRAQQPDLAELPIVELTNGWDNVIYRLGDELTVRLPRREVAAALVRSEQRWLPELSARLPLPVPAPVRIGVPDETYPWPWSVCRWFPGEVAAAHPPDDDVAAAEALGAFLAALHRPAPESAPHNPVRGGPLDERDAVTRERLAAIADLVDVDRVEALWFEHLGIDSWSRDPVWLHGDLHPANLLVHDGALSSVIDFGDITAGDPATDLAVAWMLFDVESRAVFRSAVGDVDDHTWRRARGWALSLALAYLAHSADHPVIAAVGRRTLAEVLAEAA